VQAEINVNVEQVIAIAKEWVDTQASQMPGFCGAHLMGGITYTPKVAIFPSYRDVDLSIVLDNDEDGEVHDVAYRGLILEYGQNSRKRYAHAETILADPELASNLAADSILADPEGILAKLQATVAKEYARRKWVLARCSIGEKNARAALEALEREQPMVGFLVNLVTFILGLTELSASATLTAPTHRRCLIVMRESLTDYGHSELAERLLEVIGFAHMSATSVAAYLQECAATFDRAVQITRTPVLYKFKLQPHVRPYIIEGAQAMIDEGYHREAMYWIWTNLAVAWNAIQTDGTEEEKPLYQAKLDRLLLDMGWLDPQARQPRLVQAQILADDVFRVVGRIVDSNPKLFT
jgi:hypothetical protein